MSISPSPCTQDLTSSTPYQSTYCDNDIFMSPSYNSSTATDMQSPNGWHNIHNIDSMNSNTTVKNYKIISHNNNNMCSDSKKTKTIFNKNGMIVKGDDKCNTDKLLLH